MRRWRKTIKILAIDENEGIRSVLIERYRKVYARGYKVLPYFAGDIPSAIKKINRINKLEVIVFGQFPDTVLSGRLRQFLSERGLAIPFLHLNLVRAQ